MTTYNSSNSLEIKTTEGGLFSSPSLATLEKKEEIDIGDVKIKIQKILDSTFGSGIKTEIVPYSDRLSFACPYCGDSFDNPRKKRGNVFYDSLAFHCYNCGEHHSIHRMFEDYNRFLNLEPFELMKYKMAHKIEKKSFDGLSFLINETISKFSFSKNYLIEKFGFRDIKHTEGERYLLSRFQSDMNKFAWDAKTKSVVIFNIDNEDNVIGFQKRILNKYVTNKYINYNLKNIYTELNLPVTEEIENLSAISLIFGLLTVNFTKKITLFEGSLDSFLYPNSIASSTANRDLPFDAENIRFWFDFDKTGNKVATEMLMEGETIFLWKKMLRDYDIDFDGVKKIDLTDIYKICKAKKISINFENYFSNDRMSVVFL